ncbi:sorbin [Echinococcus granulosus]|uniref:Sorbin n=1 Tax=Echinococcus granulosus TaxID=6210 RepID=W6UDH4_ECHGR|nr:sorbin [Echinococcus granulosus]EUB56372.1 sorbin [Echinococcus granulosus]
MSFINPLAFVTAPIWRYFLRKEHKLFCYFSSGGYDVPKLPEKPNNQSPPITSLQTDRADFDDGIQKSMSPEPLKQVFFQRNAKQDAVLGELTQRLGKSKSFSDDSPTSESAPPPLHKPPDDNAMPLHREKHELSTKTFVWLMVENIPATLQTQSLGFKNNDILRWLDYEPKYLESEPPPLPAGRFLDCETWSGQLVVVPSDYARPISSSLELAQVLQRMPRARVIKDFVGTGDDDLSVGAGEVIYLLFECDSTYFMAMNKGLTRGRVPKSVLNVLVAP